ncbi:HIRAN domain-containing protein [Novosphingobium clariflavum]|uniref:HIRAN domain-containing protein n=1 Tax=Novosphingobium clariflavum TaxID=2029884 RepID=A0ABV6SFW0_9SPHN|nr:HIRAN domain-containing protein [Novosphingobium clariflavum]
MTSIPEMSFAVVGVAHPNADGSNRQFEILLCHPGEPLTLVPERQNPHDPHAVAVYSCRDVQLGYISADRARQFGAQFSGDLVRAVFQRRAAFGAWVRVSFDGREPHLTGAMLAEDGESGDAPIDDDPPFYPDEIWED